MRKTTMMLKKPKNPNSWSAMCGRETKGSRWWGSSPGKGEVVLKWYFLAGRQISGKGIWGCLLLSICFSSGYPVLFLKHTWIFRIHSSPGENTENQGTLLLNDFSLSDQLTESWGSTWWLLCMWRSCRNTRICTCIGLKFESSQYCLQSSYSAVTIAKVVS